MTWRRVLGSGLGLGYLPIAPGTWGSLLPVAAAAGLFGVAGLWEPATDPVAAALRYGLFLSALVALYLLGVALGDRARDDWGRGDPGPFVLDEVVGQMIALAPLPPRPTSWPLLLTAFLAFRAFDVWKPPPCRRLEGLPGGLGIMADDVAAGFYALLVVLICMAI